MGRGRKASQPEDGGKIQREEGRKLTFAELLGQRPCIHEISHEAGVRGGTGEGRWGRTPPRPHRKSRPGCSLDNLTLRDLPQVDSRSALNLPRWLISLGTAPKGKGPHLSSAPVHRDRQDHSRWWFPQSFCARVHTPLPGLIPVRSAGFPQPPLRALLP